MPMTGFRIARVIALIVVLSSAAHARAEEKRATYEVTVEAGKHDRTNTVIRVPLEIPESVSLDSSFFLTLSYGESRVSGQITAPRVGSDSDKPSSRELHFVLPKLQAGTSTTMSFSLPVFFAGSIMKQGYFWDEPAGKGATTLHHNGVSQPVLTYVHPILDETDAKTREQTYKPFHHVHSPDGKRIVTKGPGGQYTHHRGIYFGFNRITYGDGLKCDVWHCGKPAHQAHENVLSSETGYVLGRHRVQIGWHGAKGEKFAEEQRELTVYNVAGGQFIEFASLVKSADGNPIKLDGDPQHAGFHFRADNEVSEKTKSQTYYLRPDGQGKPGETRNWDAKKREPKAVNEPWKVMSFVLGETRYSALYLDHPGNPKEARSSERDYGRFGSYFEYEITKEKPLRVNYRLILKEEEFTAEEAERMSADFADPPKVTVRKR
jgi:hypothetical protein